MKTPEPELAAQTAVRLVAIREELQAAPNPPVTSIDDMAKAIGVSYQTLVNWENGYNPPTIYPMLRLVDLFGLTLEWIYRGRSEGLDYGKSVRLAARLAAKAAPSISADMKPLTDSAMLELYHSCDAATKIKLGEVLLTFRGMGKAPDEHSDPSKGLMVPAVNVPKKPRNPTRGRLVRKRK